MNTDKLLMMARRSLELFESGEIPLHQLVGELRSVQDSLQEPPAKWLEDYDKLRFSLEEANAFTLDESTSESGRTDELVSRAIGELKRLVNSAL